MGISNRMISFSADRTIQTNDELSKLLDTYYITTPPQVQQNPKKISKTRHRMRARIPFLAEQSKAIHFAHGVCSVAAIRRSRYVRSAIFTTRSNQVIGGKGSPGVPISNMIFAGNRGDVPMVAVRGYCLPACRFLPL